VTFLEAEKLEAVEREITLRRRVYQNRVATGRMSADFAARQIAIFEAIAADYRRRVDAERLI
jgi:hypothetical protein